MAKTTLQVSSLGAGAGSALEESAGWVAWWGVGCGISVLCDPPHDADFSDVVTCSVSLVVHTTNDKK